MDHLVRLETETRLEVLGLCTKCTCKNVLTFFILVTFFTFVNVFPENLKIKSCINSV